jgi:CRISP-associated protein Cas1
MKTAIYLFEPIRLFRKDNTLFLEWKAGKEPIPRTDYALELEEEQTFSEDMSWWEGRPKFLPLERLASIHCYNYTQMDTNVMQLLAKNEIPVHIYGYHTNYIGSFLSKETLPNGKLLVKQVRAYSSAPERLTIAKAFLHGASANLIRNMKYYLRRDLGNTNLLDEVEKLAIQIDTANSIPELLGIEGNIRQRWYRFLDDLLADEYKMMERNYRPPDNPANAVLSFLNMMVYTTVNTELYRTQLNPTVGFLHEGGRHQYPLAYDIAEIFKPLLSDALLITLFRKGILKVDDFEESLNGCYLNEQGRPKVVRAFEARLRTSVQHRKLNRSVSYRYLIRLECYKLIKHLLNGDPYDAFRLWW